MSDFGLVWYSMEAFTSETVFEYEFGGKRKAVTIPQDKCQKPGLLATMGIWCQCLIYSCIGKN